MTLIGKMPLCTISVNISILRYIINTSLFINLLLLCILQHMPFNTTLYASPVVLVSVHHQYDRKAKMFVPPENNIITAWVEV